MRMLEGLCNRGIRTFAVRTRVIKQGGNFRLTDIARILQCRRHGKCRQAIGMPLTVCQAQHFPLVFADGELIRWDFRFSDGRAGCGGCARRTARCNTGSLRFRKDCVYSALGVNAAIDLNIALPFDKDKQRRADRVALDEIPIKLYGAVFIHTAVNRDLLTVDCGLHVWLNLLAIVTVLFADEQQKGLALLVHLIRILGQDLRIGTGGDIRRADRCLGIRCRLTEVEQRGDRAAADQIHIVHGCRLLCCRHCDLNGIGALPAAELGNNIGRRRPRIELCHPHRTVGTFQQNGVAVLIVRMIRASCNVRQQRHIADRIG